MPYFKVLAALFILRILSVTVVFVCVKMHEYKFNVSIIQFYMFINFLTCLHKLQAIYQIVTLCFVKMHTYIHTCKKEVKALENGERRSARPLNVCNTLKLNLCM